MLSLKAQQHLALIARAKANREKLGPQRRPGRPGLPPSQRCSPAYVTGLDLVDFPRDLRGSHRRELLRRRDPTRTPPVDVLVLAFAALFNGLKPGGAWLQLALELQQQLLGYGESTLQASHKRLVDAGHLWRHEQMRELEWVDREGRRHYLLEVWAKMRITTEGIEHLRSLGESRRVITMVGAQRARVSVVVGLASWLLKACGALLRLLARRFASAFEKKTPPLRGETQREEEPVRGASSRSPVSSTTEATGPPSRTSGASPPDAGSGGSMGRGRTYQQAEFVRLKANRAFTAAQGYAPLYWNGDRMGRRALEKDFRELYQAGLHRWFVQNSTPEERLIQIARVAADAELLALFEAAEPPETEKRFQFHTYGRRWQPTGRGVPGGRWVSAGASRVDELKKQQAADRADGVLPPKKPRRPRA